VDRGRGRGRTRRAGGSSDLIRSTGAAGAPTVSSLAEGGHGRRQASMMLRMIGYNNLIPRKRFGRKTKGLHDGDSSSRPGVLPHTLSPRDHAPYFLNCRMYRSWSGSLGKPFQGTRTVMLQIQGNRKASRARARALIGEQGAVSQPTLEAELEAGRAVSPPPSSAPVSGLVARPVLSCSCAMLEGSEAPGEVARIVSPFIPADAELSPGAPLTSLS